MLMIFYIARRLASAISVVLVALVFSFTLFYLVPADPARQVCGPKCPPERLAEIKSGLGLDRSKPDQFIYYFEGIFAGHTDTNNGTLTACPAPCLGFSYTLAQPVTKLIAQALPVTVEIVLGAAVIFLLLGIATGVIAAKFQGSAVDRGIVIVTQALGSIPYFIFALIVALYATFLPPSGYVPLTSNPAKWFTGMLAAWICLGVANSTLYTRYARASMIESLNEDFVRTARAKGLSGNRVLWKHALRAALTPIATIFGVDLAGQLAGAIFTEVIFGLNGLGQLTIRAFQQFDLPVLMATMLIGAVFLVAMNLIVDLVYTVLDPRVRLT
jgi:peptide/nickel transport system permease protein